MATKFVPVMAVAMIVLSACGNPNRVLFVTTTQIGIDVDSKSQSANIGYDRYEGYVGPAYENGGVPPVIARLESNLSVTNPKISQIYSTGDAARLASGGSKKWQTKPLAGQRRIMFFGTGTNFGLKATFSTEAPAFTLGFKRQEFSLIPIGTKTKQAQTATRANSGSPATPGPKSPDQSEDIYGSVLAALDLNIENKSFAGTGVGVSQFFATGDAADALAQRSDIIAAFGKAAKKAMNIREIDCVKHPDATSQQILDWLRQDSKHKNTLKSIIKSEFGSDITNWELINCEDFAEQRRLVLKRHNIAP